MLQGHGDDIYSHKVKIVSNFSSNVDTRQDLSALQSHLCQHISSIHSYPEPDAYSLAKLLADRNSVKVENICVTNGATEAIYLIAQAFSGCKTAIIVPTFSEYEDACTVHAHQLRFYEKLEDVSSDTQLIWLCNPNNPTGAVYDKDQLIDFVANHAETYFVFDQSYAHFIEQEVLSIEEIVSFKNIIQLHSMTKHYAIPGLRLGYMSAHGDIMQKIGKYRMPWSVNQLAIEAGKFLIESDFETKDIGEYLAETKRLIRELEVVEGLSIYPTQTHFLLCRLDNRKAKDLKKYLIEKHGILIRDAGNFRGLDERCFRISTQSRDENNLLIKAIKEWV